MKYKVKTNEGVCSTDNVKVVAELLALSDYKFDVYEQKGSSKVRWTNNEKRITVKLAYKL